VSGNDQNRERRGARGALSGWRILPLAAVLLAAAAIPAAVPARDHGPRGGDRSGQRGGSGHGPRTGGPARGHRGGRNDSGNGGRSNPPGRRSRDGAPRPSHDAPPADRGAQGHRQGSSTGAHKGRGRNAGRGPGRNAGARKTSAVSTGTAAPTPVAAAPIPVPAGSVTPAPTNVPSTAPPAAQLPRLGRGVEDALASGRARSEARGARSGGGAPGAGVSGVGAGTLAAFAGGRGLGAPDRLAALSAAGAPAGPGIPAGRTTSRVPALLGDALAGVPAGVWALLAALGGLALLFAGTTTAATIASHRRGRALSQVEALAVTDSLTGLLVRGALEGRLAAEVGRARRYNRQVSVVFFDVRGLKRINDVHGHGAGDRLLREVGALLQTTSRDHDVCGRIGGDECVVVLPEDDGAGADAFRKRVYAALPQARANVGLTTDWDLTSGVATFPRDGLTPGDLLDTADRRLYQDRGIEIDPPGSLAR
jgi:diguanylate cyclase (GGDEF)-like protein